MVIPPVAGSRCGGGIGSAPGADGLHEWAPLPYPSAAPASTPTEEGFGWRRRGRGQTPRAPPHSAASGSRPGWRVGCAGNPRCRRRTTPRSTADRIESSDCEAIRFPCFFRPHRFEGHLQETDGPPTGHPLLQFVGSAYGSPVVVRSMSTRVVARGAPLNADHRLRIHGTRRLAGSRTSNSTQYLLRSAGGWYASPAGFPDRGGAGGEAARRNLWHGNELQLYKGCGNTTC